MDGWHATSPSRIREQMGEAGYTLVDIHDVVTGYWFGIFVTSTSA